MKLRIVVLIIVLMFCFISPVSATIIVDTGPGPSSVGGRSLYGVMDNGTFFFQSLGGKFTLVDDTTLTAVYGWIGANAVDSIPGTAHVSIYSDGGQTPGTQLFSSQFVAGPSDNWYGSNSLDWFLDSGNYWVTFEVLLGDTLKGYMPYPAEFPLGDYVFENNTTSGNWAEFDSLDLGVRIVGTPVPEPSTFLLLGGGLAGLALVVRRRRKE
jgi:hypothetical protein